MDTVILKSPDGHHLVVVIVVNRRISRQWPKRGIREDRSNLMLELESSQLTDHLRHPDRFGSIKVLSPRNDKLLVSRRIGSLRRGLCLWTGNWKEKNQNHRKRGPGLHDVLQISLRIARASGFRSITAGGRCSLPAESSYHAWEWLSGWVVPPQGEAQRIAEA